MLLECQIDYQYSDNSQTLVEKVMVKHWARTDRLIADQ
jgi:hypothetical protein